MARMSAALANGSTRAATSRGTPRAPSASPKADVYKRQFLHLARAGRRRYGAVLVAVSIVALAAGTVVLALHQQSLAGVANNELAASALVPGYGTAIVFQMCIRDRAMGTRYSAK